MSKQIFENDKLKCIMEENKHLGADKHFLTLKISKNTSKTMEINLKAVLEDLILIGADKANSTSNDTIQLKYSLTKNNKKEFNFLTEDNGIKNKIIIDGEIDKEKFSKEVKL